MGKPGEFEDARSSFMENLGGAVVEMASGLEIKKAVGWVRVVEFLLGNAVRAERVGLTPYPIAIFVDDQCCPVPISVLQLAERSDDPRAIRLVLFGDDGRIGDFRHTPRDSKHLKRV